MKISIQLNGEPHEIDATRRGNTLHVEHDGQQFELKIISNAAGQIVAEHAGRLLKIAGTRSGDARQLAVNGRTATYQRITAESGQSAAAEAGTLSASIPAVVSEILVSVGDPVTTGDKLILLESMKMIIPIQAPVDGVVESINCAAGDSVQPNVPLIVLK